ncbi:MAG: uridine diphosphate-N-acetylglucosamine-binding protein YvcK [Clostridiales Family XIII bacterium]|jgi:uncharacterized cofD-like protein|nr:uridine diphosphate-N-acetylglucosamine-binding protein YvcK [Clostridiales Family XIII bacterium]
MMSKKKITVIGGGTGLSVLLRGIKEHDVDLQAIVSVADDGGSSGFLREDLGMLPPGDIRSCLLALASEEEGMQELLAYRFSEGRLSGQSMGNLIIAALNDIYGNLEDAIDKVGDVLKVKGKVVPVTGEHMTLMAELENGCIVIGESAIPKVSIGENSPIIDVFLDSNELISTKSARDAIMEADIVILGPGSLYTSIIPNLLVDGINACLHRSKAKKVYVVNVMTQPGETDHMNVSTHVKRIIHYTSNLPIDAIIVNNHRLTHDELLRYTNDGAKQVLFTDDDERQMITDMGIQVIEDSIIDIKMGYIRTDAQKVADIIMQLM